MMKDINNSKLLRKKTKNPDSAHENATRSKMAHSLSLWESGNHKPQFWVAFHHPGLPEGPAEQSFISS